MQKIINLFKRNGGEDVSSSGLKKKTLLCSTEAAAISIGIHVALILTAGSVIVFQHVQKGKADFKGEKISRPKLERRQLQMPVKVKDLQKKNSRPKMQNRMASASQASFALPDMLAMGGLGDVGFERGGGSGGGRDLKSMGAAGNLGLGVSSVNFFSARSSGEKIVFVIDASTEMMVDSKGGLTSYEFVKDRINRMVDGMNSATLFNIILYNDKDVVLFKPKMSAATAANKELVKKWFTRVNSTANTAGKISNLGFKYESPRNYEDSVVSGDEQSWLKAVQAAMEQQADNVFVICARWPKFLISDAHQLSMFGLDTSKEDEWLASKGWSKERIAKRDAQVAENVAKAVKAFNAENEARKKAGKAPMILDDVPGQGNWYRYMYDPIPKGGLGLKKPEEPPRMITTFLYTPEQIIDHLDSVYKYNYKPNKLDKPKVFMVNLVASDGIPEGEDDVKMKKVAQAFKGSFELLRGANTVEAILKINKDLD